MAGEALSIRVARTIRATLDRRGRTQEWLAGAAGIPQRTLARRLHHSHPSSLSLEELASIASALDVNMIELLYPDPRTAAVGVDRASGRVAS